MTAKTVRVIDIAEILGVSHRRASKIVEMPDFPKPIGREGRSRLWDRREVVAWARSGTARSPGADYSVEGEHARLRQGSRMYLYPD